MTALDLSQDANDLANYLFFDGYNKEITFHMQKSKPSDRCQVALDELVDKGFLYKKPHPPKGVSYFPTEKMDTTELRAVTKDSGLKITQRI